MTGGIEFRDAVVQLGGFRLVTGTAHAQAGRVTVLIGVNGSGKSTALRAAAGLLRPVSGAVLAGGKPVCEMAAGRRAARIAFVPQRFEVGAPFTVREVVQLGHAVGEPDASGVARAMADTGVAPLADRPFHALSGGQQQRVVVARALAQHRPGGILLLDEAFAAVDPAEAAGLVGAIRGLAARGSTILVATHDLALASALGDDAWFLERGQSRGFGPADELLRAGPLGRFLGVAVAEAATARGAIAAADYGAMLPRSSKCAAN